MNLSYIRDYISNVTDYDATANSDYSAQLDAVINEVYRNLFSEKPFTFAQKEVKIPIYTDVTLTGSGTYNSSTGITTVDTTDDVPEWVEGNIVEIEGNEYTVLYNDRTVSTRFYIKERVSNFTDEDVVFKNRFIRLPHDCVSILQVSHRSYEITPTDVGRFVPLTRYEDEYYNLPLDEKNIPNYWLPQDPQMVRSPTVAPSVQASTTSAGQGDRTVGVMYSYVMYDDNGEEFEIESGLSEPSDPLELNDTQRLVVQLPDVSAYGLSRRIYIINDAGDKQFKGMYRVGDLVPPHSFGSLIFDFTEDSFNDGTFLLENPAYEFPNGYRQTIRLYPRQAEDFELSVRYIYRPKPLYEDSDSLEIPASHALIVAYGALYDILNKHDNTQLAMLYKQKYDMEVIKLEQRFLTQTPRRFVKGFMKSSGVDTVPMFRPLKRLP